jgi:pilus assembly protein Flp/PilA
MTRPQPHPWHSRCDVAARDAASAAHKSLKRGAAANRIAPGAVHRPSGEDLMTNLVNYVKSLAIQEDGQDLLEYALLVALIALVAIGAVTAAGGAVSTIFSSIAAAISV